MVRSVDFYSCLKSHALIFSALLPRVLPRVTVATDVMKNLIPLLLHQLGTRIRNNHPVKRRQTSKNMEAVGCASACREISRTFPDIVVLILSVALYEHGLVTDIIDLW